MHKFQGYFLWLLLISLAPVVQADVTTSKEALKSLEANVKYYTLDNGLRVILYKRSVAPVFAGALTVRVGGVNETPGITGISHMFEHMAFKGTNLIGTKDFTAEKKLLEEVEALETKKVGGAGLSPDEMQRLEQLNHELKGLWDATTYDKEVSKRGGTGLNATTESELTQYFINLPVGAFEFWSWLESERILNPVMRQFYSERDVVMEERRYRYEDSPEGKLYERLLFEVFKVHPYHNPVIGFSEDISALTATKVDQFRRKYYVPGNMVLSVVGDIDPDQAIKTIRRYFGRIAAGPVPSQPSILEPAQSSEQAVVVKAKSSPELAVAYHKPQYPDLEDVPISIGVEILAGSRTSPLFDELVDKRKLASNISYDEVPGKAYPNALMFFMVPRAQYSNLELLRGFDQVIESFLKRGVSDAELDRAKRAIAMGYLSHLQSNEALATSLAQAELLYGDWRASMKWYALMVGTTKEQVDAAMRKYLVKTNRTVGRLERGDG